MRRDLFKGMNRKEVKKLLDAERKRRSNGNWGEWEVIHHPFRHSTGWLADVSKAHRNKVFCVLEREVSGAIHLAVSSLTEVRPSWYEMQRIKDDLAGEKATAVEVYPPHDQIVDGANMFHLWVLPKPLPFTLA